MGGGGQKGGEMNKEKDRWRAGGRERSEVEGWMRDSEWTDGQTDDHLDGGKKRQISHGWVGRWMDG